MGDDPGERDTSHTEVQARADARRGCYRTRLPHGSRDGAIPKQQRPCGNTRSQVSTMTVMRHRVWGVEGGLLLAHRHRAGY